MFGCVLSLALVDIGLTSYLTLMFGCVLSLALFDIGLTSSSHSHV